MLHIATAGNSTTACLQVVLDKGFKVTHREGGTYHATKEGFSYAAETPIELLGLVALGEMYGEDWQHRGLGRDAWEQIEYEDE
jgi:hypothetical protein